MATATQNVDPNAQAAIAPRATDDAGNSIGSTSNESRVTIKYVEGTKKNDETGQEEPVINYVVLAEDQANKRVEDLTAQGKSPEIVKIRTFVYHQVDASKGDPLEQFRQLVPDAEAQQNIVNRGYVLRQQQILRDYMLDLSEQDTREDAPYDLLVDAAEKSERQKATPEQKALKAVLGAAEKMSPEQAQEFMKSLQSLFAGKVAESES